MRNEERNESNSIRSSAKSVEEAIEQGLTQLNLNRDQVDIEVIREGKRGVFGLGAEDAIVLLRPIIETPAPPQEPAVDEPASDAPPPEQPPEVAEGKELPADESNELDAGQPPVATPGVDFFDEDEDDIAQIAPEDIDAVTEIAVEYLSNLLDHLGIEGEITTRIATDLVEPGEDPPLVLDITGPDLGILIGRRSETLRALQYMLRLMVSKRLGRWQPLMVDVESYRIRRRTSLHQLAVKMAERAVSNNKRVVLEAMPPYERRIIHIALRDNPSVMTKSVGSDDNRKVTIIPK